jgi:hypothetical protein
VEGADKYETGTNVTRTNRVQMNFIFSDNVPILCLSCNVKKVRKLVRFKQKGQKQVSFLAFHKCCQGCLNIFLFLLKTFNFLGHRNLITVKSLLSCNQYICCTNILYKYIFALFVLDELENLSDLNK